MSKCRYDLSEDCNDTDCLKCVLDKIRAEIERQEKWLLQAGYNAHNVDIAFDAVKHHVKEYINSQQRTGRWIEHFDEIGKWYECDQCHTDWGGPVNYCPNCGAKMEVNNDIL